MVRYCNNCGTQLDDEHAPCPTCGAQTGQGQRGLPVGSMLPGVDLAIDPDLIVVTRDQEHRSVVLFQGKSRVTIPLADVQRLVERIAEQARTLGEAESASDAPDAIEPDTSWPVDSEDR